MSEYEYLVAVVLAQCLSVTDASIFAPQQSARRKPRNEPLREPSLLAERVMAHDRADSVRRRYTIAMYRSIVKART